MKTLFSTSVAGVLLLSGGTVVAGELPIYEFIGFPITQHQLMAVNSAQVQERSPSPPLTLGGMPASPHQIAVLTPRQRIVAKQAADTGERAAGSSVFVPIREER
jgi:hypothetical protein